MRLNKIAALALVALSAVGAFQHASYWVQLPDRVATHFGANGQPDDWMHKNAATFLLVGLQIVLPWTFMLMAACLHHFPNWSINVPYREYWLHPDRRNVTLARMSGMLSWVAVLTAMEIMVMSHLTFQANMAQGGLNMPVFFVALVLYLVSVLTLAFGSMPPRPPRAQTAA